MKGLENYTQVKNDIWSKCNGYEAHSTFKYCIVRRSVHQQPSADFPNSGSWDLKHAPSWGVPPAPQLLQWEEGYTEEKRERAWEVEQDGLDIWWDWRLLGSHKEVAACTMCKDGVSLCIQRSAARGSKNRLRVVLPLGNREPQGSF